MGRSFANEMMNIIKNKKLLISFIGILLIPIMYSGMLIGAFWDPYGQLSKLPVAVVNEDTGASLEGKTIAAGNDFVNELKQNDEFKWDFVSKEAAESGLRDGRYYLAVEIPADFSKRAATLLDSNPQPASLVYVKNEGANYLAGKIGDSAIEKLKSEVSAKMTKTYAESVFESISQVSDGFQEASDGASQLHDGAEKTKEGANLLQSNIAKLADGSLQLEDGVSKLQTGASQLASGASRLSDGAGALADGLKQLDGAAAQLHSGAADAAKAGGQLAAGLSSAQQGEAELASQAAALADALAAAAAAAGPDGGAAGSTSTPAADGGQPAAGGSAAAEQAAQLQQLAASARALAAGASQLADGGGKLAAGGDALQQGQAKLQQGLEQLSAQLSKAAGSSAQLAQGAAELASGASQVNSGASAAKHGAADLADGSVKLADGSGQLATGAGALADGSSELSEKLGDAAHDSSKVNGTDKLYDMFASPVDVTEQKLTEVPNYGTGFSPYFMALGLFVGALLSTVVLPLRNPAAAPRSGLSWYTGKTGMVVVVAVLQALIADMIMLYGLKLHVQNTGLFIAFSVVSSFTFMMIIQFLVTVMDNPGRFLGVILLILQLTGSAGTYPKELLPEWLQKVGEFLPMTYAIRGYREIISGGDLSRARVQMWTVLLFAIPFMAMLLIYFVLVFRKKYADSSHGGNGGGPALPAAGAEA
ncbi:YhgE/Pip domain-containing protein [Paenibacillus protaetiae]|uniref:YhgE/Pip domain-containing protein n=1 Tax=Paenibacillus protaetiae TaxID=2509456 RepID=A0A4P6F4M7_9BACL|nr:YhgE/Pip domain-containing protein [Paenibacillus protaetiae]QAY68137.1 YhgE/Pip domain-containing protein [Paenibacillus protaetiae]